MSEFLRRIRLPLLFAGLLLGTLVLMLGDRRAAGEDRHWVTRALLEVATPVQKAITRPVHVVRDTWRRYVALVDLQAENEALRAELARVEEENLQYREALVASGQLRRIAEMRRDFEVPLLPADVVGQDASPWFRSLLLDRGRSSEVRSGMPVMVDQGVVGLVSATSLHAARAMMILDRRSAVDAMIQRSRARGLVRGLGTGELEFEFMVRGDDVEEGDVVITSGVGGVYPKGLRIGTVRSVNADRTELLHTARVEPAVDFGRLEQVFVMLRRGPTMDLLFGGGDGDLPEPGSAKVADGR
jgi:rod shape-determining protein MreC